jgi:hypothetical protein
MLKQDKGLIGRCVFSTGNRRRHLNGVGFRHDLDAFVFCSQHFQLSSGRLDKAFCIRHLVQDGRGTGTTSTRSPASTRSHQLAIKAALKSCTAQRNRNDIQQNEGTRLLERIKKLEDAVEEQKQETLHLKRTPTTKQRGRDDPKGHGVHQDPRSPGGCPRGDCTRDLQVPRVKRQERGETVVGAMPERSTWHHGC